MQIPIDCMIAAGELVFVFLDLGVQIESTVTQTTLYQWSHF